MLKLLAAWDSVCTCVYEVFMQLQILFFVGQLYHWFLLASGDGSLLVDRNISKNVLWSLFRHDPEVNSYHFGLAGVRALVPVWSIEDPC